VTVGVAVGVRVGVVVDVRVGVRVGVLVGVGVGVGVRVGVAVGVGVGVGGTGLTVSVAVFVTPPYMAVIVTAVEEATPVVVIVAPAEAEPAGIVRLAGIEATVAFELDRVTMAPPAGAGPLSVRVATLLFPPTGFVGLSEIERSVGTAVTVNVAVFVTPA
jgi:hypothetical protein